MARVTKAFGKVQALKGVDLVVRPGEVVALLGPNGAGKTTVQSILLGQRKPDDGIAFLFGGDPRLAQNRMRVGATPQDTAFPETLKIAEIMGLVAAHFAKPPNIGETIERFGLGELTTRQVRQLSGGERRRLAVALAFAGGADAIFLDEPTTGMDVSARARLWDEVRDFSEAGGTLFLTTHYMEEAEALASRVVLIDHGRIVRQGSVAEIKSAVEVRKLSFRSVSCPDLPTVVGAEHDGDLHIVLCRDADVAVRALVASGVEFHDLEVRPASLEDAVMASLEGQR